jgi:hypothetical protein
MEVKIIKKHTCKLSIRDASGVGFAANPLAQINPRREPASPKCPTRLCPRRPRSETRSRQPRPHPHLVALFAIDDEGGSAVRSGCRGTVRSWCRGAVHRGRSVVHRLRRRRRGVVGRRVPRPGRCRVRLRGAVAARSVCAAGAVGVTGAVLRVACRRRVWLAGLGPCLPACDISGHAFWPDWFFITIDTSVKYTLGTDKVTIFSSSPRLQEKARPRWQACRELSFVPVLTPALGLR